MKLSQNPFSLYDFLGYLIPGMFLLLFLLNLASYDPNGGFEQFFYSSQLSQLQDYAGFILAAYLLGHLVSISSSYSVEKYALWKYGYPSKFILGVSHGGYWTKRREERRGLQYVLRMLMYIALLPISVLDTLVSCIGLSGIQSTPLDKPLVKLVQLRVQEMYTEIGSGLKKEELDARREDFFSLAYHYVQEHCENHAHKIYNYVALYGLMRSLTLSFVILFWYAASQMVVFDGQFCTGCIFCLGSIAAIAYTFFVAYRKFLKRYSQEVLLTLAVMKRNATGQSAAPSAPNT